MFVLLLSCRPDDLAKAVRRFTLSCAGYCVATYVMVSVLMWPCVYLSVCVRACMCVSECVSTASSGMCTMLHMSFMYCLVQVLVSWNSNATTNPVTCCCVPAKRRTTS